MSRRGLLPGPRHPARTAIAIPKPAAGGDDRRLGLKRRYPVRPAICLGAAKRIW
jgi:hypothetical protein